jgi:hypothetical protein
MIDRALLRMSTALLFAGQVLYIVVTQFHAGGDANDHPAIFAVYAGNGIWKAVHVGGTSPLRDKSAGQCHVMGDVRGPARGPASGQDHTMINTVFDHRQT